MTLGYRLSTQFLQTFQSAVHTITQEFSKCTIYVPIFTRICNHCLVPIINIFVTGTEFFVEVNVSCKIVALSIPIPRREKSTDGPVHIPGFNMTFQQTAPNESFGHSDDGRWVEKTEYTDFRKGSDSFWTSAASVVHITYDNLAAHLADPSFAAKHCLKQTSKKKEKKDLYELYANRQKHLSRLPLFLVGFYFYAACTAAVAVGSMTTYAIHEALTACI